MKVSLGDYIIRGVQGEVYPCKPDIFAATYEPADADGLPVVHTVGDLTARHQLARPRIRVAGREGKLKIVKPSDAYPGTVTLIWGDCWEDAALEEPCEVLP